MYHCYLHNWSSPVYSCPQCHKQETRWSNASTDVVLIPNEVRESAQSFRPSVKSEREAELEAKLASLTAEVSQLLDLTKCNDLREVAELVNRPK